MLGITGAATVNNAIGSNAKRSTWAEIQPVLNLAALDIDGDGVVRAHTDGMIMLRAMLGVPSGAILSGVTSTGVKTRPAWSDMRTYLNNRCSGAFL